MSLEVTPIEGETFTFMVSSRSRPSAPHRVEIDAYGFNGACSCESHKFRNEPKLCRGAKAEDALRCVHIRRARSYFLDEILPVIAKSLNRKR